MKLLIRKEIEKLDEPDWQVIWLHMDTYSKNGAIAKINFEDSSKVLTFRGKG
jgi:hypothetical protein